MLASLIDQLAAEAADLRHAAHAQRRRPRKPCRQGGSTRSPNCWAGWLVRQLPETTTLFCIVDGVYLFERDEFKPEALPVLLSLIHLAGERSVPATIKVCFLRARRAQTS